MHLRLKRSTRLLSLMAVSALALTGSVISLNPGVASAASTPTPAPNAGASSTQHTDVNPERATPAPPVEPSPSGRYIVVLTGNPTVTYPGNVTGFPATKLKKGEKLNATTASVQKYEAHLKAAQGKVAAAKGVKVQRNFTTALNGFVANLDAKQAQAMAQDPKVLMVAPDTENSLASSSMDAIGLTGKKGVWQTEFSGAKNAGTGTVVGVLDSGYYPDSPYFQGAKVKPLAAGANPAVGVPYLKSPGVIAMLKGDGTTFEGLCQAGEEYTATTCNSKVISARYFESAFLAEYSRNQFSPLERLSPIDARTHGTHTASTAVGNVVKTSSTNGVEHGTTSGVAPGAKLAVYKVCWRSKYETDGGCYSSSVVEAVNQAVLDGVDVLNYSISNSKYTTTDPVSLAFLSAASAGIFIAAGGGNAGPAAATVSSGAPWLASVAATTYTNDFTATLQLSNGKKYRGTSQMATPLPDAPIVLAADVSVAGRRAANVCQVKALVPEKVAGKIVVCDRGETTRDQKADEVKAAGGVGMILTNVVEGAMDVDILSVPMLNLSHAVAPELKAQLADQAVLTANVALADTTGLPAEPLTQIAPFSSRGPLEATEGDLLKPDLAAPGVFVLGGAAPAARNGEKFALMSGTSMASPHVAGLGALILSQNPLWSPSQVKSALMTTANRGRTATGAPSTDAFAFGAGQVSPANMFKPGLTVDMTNDDYLNFAAAQGLDFGISGIKPVAARDTNVPSIAISRLVGTVTIKRTFTAHEPGVYRVTADLPGHTVVASPSLVNFSTVGEQRTVAFKITRTTAPLGEFTFGSVSLTGNGKSVRLPVAVRPLDMDAPRSVTLTSEGGTGSGVVPVVSGTNTEVPLALAGLARVTAQTGSAVPGPMSSATNANNVVMRQSVQKGAKVARFTIDSADQKANWSMYVFTPRGVWQSVTASAGEDIIIHDPAPGSYTLIANLTSSPNGAESAATVSFGAVYEDAKNATLTPESLKLKNGENGLITLNWSGLSSGTWLGVVSSPNSPFSAVVSVKVNDPA